MKKTLVSIIIVAMLLSIMSVCTSAVPAGCTAIDITDQVKFMSVVDMYKSGTPIIRDDAKYVEASMYDLSSIGKAPGTGIRDIEITDFDPSLYKDQLQFDAHHLAEKLFSYPAIWQNNAEDGSTAKAVYKISVPTTGTYEFVIVGCAQIKAENIGNDAKDRGFSYSIDGGQKYQVNISDSPLIFREYTYIYSMEDATKAITSGEYTYYQMGYVYNIKADLTAGEHTFEYYHLEYSGETVLNTGNGPRLNFAGFYYQKYLDDAALKAYTYPKAPEVTTTEKVTTKAPDPTTAKTTTATPTTAAVTTAAPDPTEPADGGCGAVVSGVAVIVAFAGAAFVAAKRKH